MTISSLRAVPVLVLRAAGINCDEEIVHAWKLAGAEPTLLHLSELVADPGVLDRFSIVTIPGGFSYGDDIAAGKILAERITLGLADRLSRFVERGGGVLGVCNGFQVLVKMGLLPGGEFGRDQVTLSNNDSAKFEARWVRLEVATDKCPYLTRGGGTKGRRDEGGNTETSKSRNVEMKRDREAGVNPQSTIPQSLIHLELPVEHAEGKVVVASADVAGRLLLAGQVALRYVDAEGDYDTYPANPNGSALGIAGLCDPTGRVFGLMPHPDRFFEHTQHPQWTRRKPTGPPDGLTIFQNAVAYWSQLR